MQFVYESKYNEGDTVYQITRYINGTHIIERQVVRVIGIVQQPSGAVFKYELTPISRYSLSFKECIETALYPTREAAQEAADKKAAEYIKRTRERLQSELAALEVSKKMRIAEATADIERDIEEDADFIRRQLKELK